MRAIVLDHPGTFRVAEVPDPAPRPAEVVVKVDCCGICGTDLHILAGEFPPTPYPITPGHEFAGVVVARGAEAKPDLPEGTRVAVDPSLFCGWCRRCRAGSMAVLRSFGPAVDLLTSGAVDPRALLSEPLPLEQFGEAVNRVRSGQGIKWHIRP